MNNFNSVNILPIDKKKTNLFPNTKRGTLVNKFRKHVTAHYVMAEESSTQN